MRVSSVMNHFRRRYRHTIIAMDGVGECRSRLAPDLDVQLLPLRVDKRTPLRNLFRFRALLGDIRPDLLLTYNWGAIDWALANRFFPRCRAIHLESGFNLEEADSQLRRRALIRRFVLSRGAHVVVPSRTLQALAARVWKLDPDKILYIPNGVDCARFAVPPKPGVIAGFEKVPGELIVGTLASLRPVKNLPRLIRAFAGAAGRFRTRLLIVGEGPDRPVLSRLATELGVGDKVVLAGHSDAPEQVLGWLDVFAISSDTEQMPNSVLQAMAAGRPIAGVDVGDVKLMVAPENRPFIVPRADDLAFQQALERLLASAETRRLLGHSNQERVRADFSQERMFRAYEAVFDQ